MDELTRYLKSTTDYTEIELEQILNKKIIITRNHVENVKFCFYFYKNKNVPIIIKLFEKYGYVFTDDDYILWMTKNGLALKFIPIDKKSNEICMTAVKHTGYALQFVPEDKKTDELCKIAVKQNIQALRFVPDNKKTGKKMKSKIFNKT